MTSKKRDDEESSSNTIIFEDIDFPMRDCDDDLIGELSQGFVEASGFFQISDLSAKDSSEVLFEDDSIPMRDSDDKLLGELTQEFCEVSQTFQRLPLYYQVGSGFEENQPGPSHAGQSPANNRPHNLNDALLIELRSGRYNKKYQANQLSFRARVDMERLPMEMRNRPLATVVDLLRELFRELIRRATEGLRGTDLIRFCILAEGLDKPISTSLMEVSDLTVEKVMAAVLKVLQSKDKIMLDEGFTTDIITIRRDVGSGGGRRVVNVAVDRFRKQSILTIDDKQDLCCARAIVYALAHLNKDKQAIKSLQDQRRPALMKRAKELHESAGVRQGPCTYREIAQFEDFLDIQIAVISTENFNKLTYKGRERTKRINLWLHDGHYDVIKSLKGFYSSNNYCEPCDKPYDHSDKHICPNSCRICLRKECISSEPKRCKDCDRQCRSTECYIAHKTRRGNETTSICDRVYQCRHCCGVFRTKERPKELHQCGSAKCPSCQKFVVSAEHLCHLSRVSPKKPSTKLIFFDFETDQASGEHVVNFAVSQYADGTEKVFKGYSACQEFCAWLFTPAHKGFTAIAHNMKAFDGQFVAEWLLQQGTAPDVIPNGSMLMSIRHPQLNITVIDSLCFLPMALAKLPKCFGLDEMKKGYFPHLFNEKKNQSYVGPMPKQEDYCPNRMSSYERESFLVWYENHKNDEFDFQKEILEYCRSDVDILRRCCLVFREELLTIADVDPFQYITIASTCMATYRHRHIIESTIAMVPIHGYHHGKNFSADAIRWLDYVSSREGISIKHALNCNGEVKIDRAFVDGFCEETKTIYQFQGCFFHGCVKCFDSEAMHPLKNTAMAALYNKTQQRTERLKSLGYSVVEVWEHEFAKMKKEDAELQTFLTKHTLQDRLIPRDSFFGGRTNAVKLFHEGVIKYVDFTSLYPWVNKYCSYPVGHPEVITGGFQGIEQYFGIVRCKVIPPRGLYLPVLPYRAQGKLMFPLCRSCVETQQQTPCCHTDDQRSLTGTWVTEEVKLAKSKGYEISEIYEVYHFTSSSKNLFKTYIDTFLKIKQESSGWPQNCRTNEEKAAYVREYEEKEGIRLDPQNISKNPGRRQVAKLALNSFWGRWGMNNLRTQLNYVTSFGDFNKLMSDPSKNVKDVYFPTPEVAAIQWESKKEFLAQDASTNIFIATFTTAWARIKLYSEMDKLGKNVLYHDTDSIVYASDGINDPPLGNFLGEFTDELDGDVITTFVSGGPKNYAYETASGKTCCKVRGFSLNFTNQKLLNFESLRRLVSSMDEKSTIPIHNEAKITRDPKRRKVINKPETKNYRIVYDKRVINPIDFSTLPYGY